VLNCEICGQECKTAQGLSGHRRLKHLVVSGGSSGGDQSDQDSVSGGDRSGERSGESGQGGLSQRAMDALRGFGKAKQEFESS